MLDNDKLIYQNVYVSDTKDKHKNRKSESNIYILWHTTQHVSGMRIFLEIKLCALARNVPILDGLMLMIRLVVGVDGVKVFCSDDGLVNFDNVG